MKNKEHELCWLKRKTEKIKARKDFVRFECIKAAIFVAFIVAMGTIMIIAKINGA